MKVTIVNVTSPLNVGQQKAADGFFEFLFKPDQKELNISGPGGVGKTYLMSHMIDEIIPRYQKTCRLMGVPAEYVDVNMTATTNKAAEVLAVATQRPTSTIHSLLGLTVKDDYSTGKSKLTKTAQWSIHSKKIIFIDEGSMLDSPLLNLLYEGTHSCKLVYVGDHCQLPPVMEKISPIYNRNIPFFELTEPMRTQNPHLLALNKQLRHTVETGEFLPIELHKGSIEHLTDDEMAAMLEVELTNSHHNSRVLAYTNNRVVQFNDHIRTMRGLPDEWQVGEDLINNSAIRIHNTQVSVEQELQVISQEPNRESHYVDDDVNIEVRRTTLQSRSGGILTDVPVPSDPNHFLALVKHYASRKNWNRMYHLKNNYPDLRQKDAATFHKSQGSSYDNVFIDLGNLSSCHQPELVARMLYVAASRAKNRVYLHGNLATKYGGLST